MTEAIQLAIALTTSFFLGMMTAFIIAKAIS